MRTISLKRLLVVMLALVFLFLGILLLIANLAHTREFLARQLQSHAQDEATALALNLAPALAEGDRARVASTVDALFDSGYFLRILVSDPDGGRLLLREQAPRVEEVPAWFIGLVPLATPIGHAEAMSGWQRVAVLEVTSHPGYAYRQLWQSGRAVVGWTLGFWALAALLAVWVLRRTLRPLDDMERLAIGIGEGRFERLGAEPRIRELSHIGRALNLMSESVERMHAEQSALIDRLQQDLYHDGQTGLYNRAYLIASTEAALEDPGNTVGMAFLRIGRLAELNAFLGRQAGDQLLKSVAERTAAVAGEFSASVGRLDGGQFAVLLENSDSQRLSQLAERLSRVGLAAMREAGAEEHCETHVGAAQVSGVRRPALFSAVDAALRDARLGPSGSFRVATGNVPGEEEMRRYLLSAIELARVRLEWQPALRCADMTTDHYEAYARITGPQGESLPAGAFVRLAEEAGLIATLDELILTHAWMALDGKEAVGSINLSAQSIVSPGFVAWMCGTLQRPERIQLEFSLRALLDTPNALEAVAELRRAGFRIVLDRYVPQTEALARLKEIRPQRIKVEGTLCRYARSDAGSRALLETLCGFARELDIRVSATGVEHEEERRALCALGMDTVQGRLFSGREPGEAG